MNVIVFHVLMNFSSGLLWSGCIPPLDLISADARCSNSGSDRPASTNSKMFTVSHAGNAIPYWLESKGLFFIERDVSSSTQLSLSLSFLAARYRGITFASMSVITVYSLLVLLLFSPSSIASALPCPECEEGTPPPPVIVTEPCDECEHQHPYPPPPVIVAEPCDECEEHHHPKHPKHPHPKHPHTLPPVIVTETCHECEEEQQHHHHPHTQKVLTSTISVCRKPTHSITPYTSGTKTYLMSSCKPTTKWHTKHAHCHKSTVTHTDVSTAYIYKNGTVIPSVVTVTNFANVTGPVRTSTVTDTIVKHRPAKHITYTSFATVTTTRPGQKVTLTSYASGMP